MGLSLSNAACYAALSSRDARFDGQFFVAVSSTKIYCRPVCRVQLPARNNCRFFESAAQAESNGYRPCLRCRPELATRWSTHSISDSLAIHATELFDASFTDLNVIHDISARLGITERHLRRLLNEHLGVSPSQYVQTRRLLFAKQLLTDTDLAVADVALMSGFGSVRRFNTAIKQAYRLTPTDIRKSRTQYRVLPPTGECGPANDVITCRLSVIPPFDFSHLLRFHERRSIASMETVQHGSYVRAIRLPAQGSRAAVTGWYRVRAINESQLQLEVSRSLSREMSRVIVLVKAQFDLDANPHYWLASLGELADTAPGIRVPGGVSGFEVAVRAILGQQISVEAATRLLTRVVNAFGDDGITGGPDKTFPTPAALASCDKNSLGELGIITSRAKAIQCIAMLILDGKLNLDPGADVAATSRCLSGVAGIGPWTVNYVLMRALRWPDAFVATDLGIIKAADAMGIDDITTWANRFRPWRAYAAMHLWHSLQQHQEGVT